MLEWVGRAWIFCLSHRKSCWDTGLEHSWQQNPSPICPFRNVDFHLLPPLKQLDPSSSSIVLLFWSNIHIHPVCPSRRFTLQPCPFDFVLTCLSSFTQDNDIYVKVSESQFMTGEQHLGKFGAKNKLLELSKAEDLKGWSDDISDQNVSTWLSLLRLPWNYCTRQMINCSNCVSSIPGAMALQLQSSRCSSCHFHNQMIGGQAERYYQLVHWSKYGDKTYTYCNIFKSKVICHLPLMYTITLWQQKTWTTYLLSGVASQRRWNIG